MIVKMAAQADSMEGVLALATLDGGMDGSLATLIPNNTRLLMETYKRVSIMYEPLNTDTISVVIQLSVPQTAREPVTVFIDNIQIVPVDDNNWINPHFWKFGVIDENDR